MDASDIDPNDTNVVPAGETLDGGGETIRTSEYQRPILDVRDGATVKNLTMLGPMYDHIQENGWWDYETSGEAWNYAASAIETNDDVTVENVRCSGWSFGGIIVRGTGVHIRDCELTDNNCRALGYGVAVYDGIPIIEWCEFNNNRHDIAQSGDRDAGYEARYNWVGPVGRIYGFEAHDPHSARIHVHHNTFEDKHGNTPRKGYGRKILIRNRGVPVEECLVENNWFKGEMTVSMSSEAREWYSFRDNHEGPSEPPEGVGQPDRDGGDEPEPNLPEYGQWGNLPPERRQALVTVLRKTSTTLAELRQLLEDSPADGEEPVVSAGP